MAGKEPGNIQIPIPRVDSRKSGQSMDSGSPFAVIAPSSQKEQDKLSRAFEDAFLVRSKTRRISVVGSPPPCAESLESGLPGTKTLVERAQSGLSNLGPADDSSLALQILNISDLLNEGASAIVDDSFTKCFKCTPSEHWNWNIYLFPMWCIGVVIRYCVLFPFRVMVLLTGLIIFVIAFTLVHFLLPAKMKLRSRCERYLTTFMCSCFVASWTGVVKYHGPRPTMGANKVYVANHTSMIDFIVLQQVCGHSVIMQKHPGWVGIFQSTVLESIGCIHFDRNSMKDRALVNQRLKDHVRDPNQNPLLIFPEGTCVNNEYCVMFKKGAFDLGATVYPIAIKYNKIFVDAFWNSKRQSFTGHLLSLMTSWAVVCDVWYLEPQTRKPENETVEEFAARVQTAVCQRAGLTQVPWDGMLKYYRPRATLTEKRRQEFAKAIREENLSKPLALPESKLTRRLIGYVPEDESK